jgi:hypothetical protein
MTAHTPAPKASGVSALLASFSTVPPPQPEASTREDFLDFILQAVTTQSSGTDNPASAQLAKEPENHRSSDAEGPDLTAASLLLALLAAPLPTLPRALANKVSLQTVPTSPLIPTTQQGATPTPTFTETKPAKPTAGAGEMICAADQAVLSKELENGPPPSSTSASCEKLPLIPIEFPALKEPRNKSAPLSGTSVANTGERMSFTPERNEIAGRTEQKLPPTAISAVNAADSGGASSDGGAKSSLAFSWHDTQPEPVTITDLSAQASAPTAPVAAANVEAPASVPSTASLDRLEEIISHEAVVIRHTGAETLGVSLRLDSDTQLFLQLTTHNGSIQASVRCERGHFAPEDAQWAQLQQSLARQNVALLPMTGGSNLNSQQRFQERSREQVIPREDSALAGTAVQSAQPRKQKGQNRSRRNWESWA